MNCPPIRRKIVQPALEKQYCNESNAEGCEKSLSHSVLQFENEDTDKCSGKQCKAWNNQPQSDRDGKRIYCWNKIGIVEDISPTEQVMNFSAVVHGTILVIIEKNEESQEYRACSKGHGCCDRFCSHVQIQRPCEIRAWIFCLSI